MKAGPLALWALLLSGTAAADPRPAVVELFTSQGCSSCPPAEALLEETAERQNIVALAFHVDYWDRFGWHDRFASPEATARQRTYQRRLGLSTIYTPQMVVDGHTDVVGTDRQGLKEALAEPRDGVPLSLANDGRFIVARIGPGKSSGDLVFIAYARSAETAVARGENAGHTLREFNIVRSAHPIGHWDGRPVELRIDRQSLPGDATTGALLIQEDDQGPILAAATTSLKP